MMNNGKFAIKDNRREGKDDEVKLVGSRVYVGKLNDSISREIIENRFRKYGAIISVTMHREHCFVQYEDENVGHIAVKAENNSIMFGNRIDVRIDKDAVRDDKQQARFIPMQVRKRSPSLDGRRDRRDNRDEPFFRQPYRERSPMDPSRNTSHRGSGRDNCDGNFRRDPEFRNSMRNDDMFKPAGSSPIRNVRSQFDGRGMSVDGMPPQNRNMHNQFEGPLGRDRHHLMDVQPQSRNMRDQLDLSLSGPGPAQYGASRPLDSQDIPPQYRVRDSYENYVDYVKPSKPNDCEIIVMNKQQRGYAEIVERRLKTGGLQVDLLFPKDNSPIMRLLRDISSRGCLYAIVILPQNEAHKSITINILYGTPQEHRNMPLEDAMNFISKNFTAYMREKLDGRQSTNMGGGGFRRDMSGELSQPGGAVGAPLFTTPPQQQQIQQQQQMQLPPPIGVTRGVQQQPSQQLPVAGVSRASDDGNQEVKSLLRLLASEKLLTVTELDVVIKHLQDTKDELLSKRETGVPSYHSSAVAQEQLQLQQTILNLFGNSSNNNNNNNNNNSNTLAATKTGRDFPALGGGGGGGVPGGVGGGGGGGGYDIRGGPGGDAGNRRRGTGRWGPPVNSQSASSVAPERSSLSINLDNPNIQKALDSLLQSGPNILQNLERPGGGGNVAYPDNPQDHRYMGGGNDNRGMAVGGGNEMDLERRHRDVGHHMNMSRDGQQQQQRPRDVDSRTARDIDARSRDVDSRQGDFFNRGLEANVGNYGREPVDGPDRFNMGGMGYGASSMPGQGRPFQGQQGVFQGMGTGQGHYQRPLF